MNDDTCPECAYKHYTAALALSQTLPEIVSFHVNMLVARAAILTGEYMAGYPNAIHRAYGALAAAENIDVGYAHHYEIRQARLALLKPDTDPLTKLATSSLDASDFVFAHVLEGVREAPRTADGATVQGLRAGSFKTKWFVDNPDLFRTTLFEAARWLANTFELHGHILSVTPPPKEAEEGEGEALASNLTDTPAWIVKAKGMMQA